MKTHVKEIIKIKTQNPDISIVDIITEYVNSREHLNPDDEEYFDFDMFLSNIKRSEYKGIKEYIKRDLVEFHYHKNKENLLFGLF